MNIRNVASQSAFFIQAFDYCQNTAVVLKRLEQSQKILEILHKRLHFTLEEIGCYTGIKYEEIHDLLFLEKRTISEGTFKKLTYLYYYITKSKKLPLCNR